MKAHDDAKAPVIMPEDAVKDDGDANTALDVGHQVNLAVGKNVITVTVEAEDGTMATYTVTVTRAGSSDATLSALSLSGIDLNIDDDGVSTTTTTDPAAVAAATSIMVTVPRHVDSTTVMATASDTAANVEYMPADADMAMKGRQVALGLGETEIKVMVTSSDMTTTSTYTITVPQSPPRRRFAQIAEPGRRGDADADIRLRHDELHGQRGGHRHDGHRQCRRRRTLTPR